MMSQSERDKYLEEMRERRKALVDPMVNVLEEVFRGVPDIRGAVLQKLLERPALGEGHFQRLREDGKIGLEVASMIVCALVRHITTGRSKEEAARILWHYPLDDHNASLCLQHYLEGLPGIKVNMDQCDEALERGQWDESVAESKSELQKRGVQ
jgi:hypothetical protein